MEKIIEKVTMKSKSLGRGLSKCYQEYLSSKNEEAPAKWKLLSKYMRVLYDNGIITVGDLTAFLSGHD